MVGRPTLDTILHFEQWQRLQQQSLVQQPALSSCHLAISVTAEIETLENYLSELSQNGLKKRLKHL